MTDRTIGKYQILSEIGRGGMAVVYLGLDPAFQRQVAIKVLPTQFLENPLLRARFEREARIIATLEHPAIVPVHDYGEQSGQLYLVMRYMPGGSLAEKIRKGALPAAEAIDILAHLAPALDAVHARGIVHRDLKPANILFDAFGNPALSDFGIAQFNEATVDLTGDAVIGTPSYMSPEQVRSDVPIDGRSDIYALGVILYEMLTGRQPYQAATPMSMAMKHLTDPVPQIRSLLPQFPTELDQILSKAMAKDRDQRYPLAAGMITDLRSLPNLPAAAAGATVVDLNENLPRQQTVPESQQINTPPPAHPGPHTPAPVSRPNKTGPLQTTSPGLARKNPWLIPVGASSLLGLVGVCTLLVLAFIAYRSGMFSAMLAAPSNQPVVQASKTVEDPPPTEAIGETPQATPAATRVPTRVVLSDNFSNHANGWPEGTEARIKYRYAGDAYRLSIEQTDTLYWATPDGEYGDLSIQVTAAQAAGGSESYFGIVCRIQDPNNFYYLVVRTDGYFDIGKFKDGVFVLLLSDEWVYSETLSQASQPYQLRADCIGDSLRLYLGDVLLGEVQDSDIVSGKFGLAAGAIGNPMEVVFDDFIVSVPK